eukprot:COSAG04_NODE_878_length_9680_cov_2.690951_6_plen_258_part_00
MCWRRAPTSGKGRSDGGWRRRMNWRTRNCFGCDSSADSLQLALLLLLQLLPLLLWAVASSWSLLGCRLVAFEDQNIHWPFRLHLPDLGFSWNWPISAQSPDQVLPVRTRATAPRTRCSAAWHATTSCSSGGSTPNCGAKPPLFPCHLPACEIFRLGPLFAQASWPGHFKACLFDQSFCANAADAFGCGNAGAGTTTSCRSSTSGWTTTSSMPRTPPPFSPPNDLEACHIVSEVKPKSVHWQWKSGVLDPESFHPSCR